MGTNRLSEYYKTVEGYHDIIEHQEVDSQMVPPALLLRFIDRSGLIVDVGAGTGINSEILDLERGRYLCIDISFAGLKIAREKGRGIPVLSDVRMLPIRDQAADTVLCSWSLEHFDQPEAVLREMVRVLKPGGRIVIWGPNWDNIFRKDFPQFAHKDAGFLWSVRRQIFLSMIRNEFLPFRYEPYITHDVAALADPGRFLSSDTDAVHCTLCQETFKWFLYSGLDIIHISDFSEMAKYVHNGLMIRMFRSTLRPLLPLLRHVPLLRWFVLRFPLVVEKPR